MVFVNVEGEFAKTTAAAMRTETRLFGTSLTYSIFASHLIQIISNIIQECTERLKTHQKTAMKSLRSFYHVPPTSLYTILTNMDQFSPCQQLSEGSQFSHKCRLSY